MNLRSLLLVGAAAAVASAQSQSSTPAPAPSAALDPADSPRPSQATEPPAASPSDVLLQPYPVNHEERVDSPADVRFLLDAPAGKHGFVRSVNGHLCTEDGRRIRFWGVNLAGWTKGSALIPPKREAALFSAELARLGINCVRFQFLDLPRQQHANQGVPETSTPSGLIDGNRDDSRVMDPEQLDRLDNFCAELKAHGIYIDFNLNVGRRYKQGDGVPGYDLIGVAKAVTYFEPRLVELQKEYARQLLAHRNPYTHLAYSEDPAVAIVEIVNENSLLEFWQRNWFRGQLVPGGPHYQLDLTPEEKGLLTRDYNAWLAQNRTAAEIAHLKAIARVGAGQPLPFLQRQEFEGAPKERFYTEGAFLTQLETSALKDMEHYLKQDLRVKSLVIGTNDHTYFIPGMPLVRTTSKFDIVDAHVYWQHPAIYGRRNTPMVNDPLHSIEVKLTRSTMVGQPFTVSEVNEPFPSDYDSEMIPLLAAYGAFQDWDGIFIYAMEPKLVGLWQPYIGDHFDITEDPVKMAQMPAGALLFLRHDVRTAEQTIERTYSSDQIYESMRLPESEDPYYTPGFPLALALKHGSRIRALDAAPTRRFEDAPANPIVSDTGQLSWHTSERHGGVVTIDTERTSALIGFVRDNGAETSRLSADISNRFAAITLSALDDQPISRSSLLLLTTCGRVENTGQVWNARRTMAEQWGGPPTRIEPITGWLLLKQIEGAVGLTVTPLDGAARPLREAAGRRLEAGWEIPIGAQPATSYLLRVIR